MNSTDINEAQPHVCELSSDVLIACICGSMGLCSSTAAQCMHAQQCVAVLSLLRNICTTDASGTCQLPSVVTAAVAGASAIYSSNSSTITMTPEAYLERLCVQPWCHMMLHHTGMRCLYLTSKQQPCPARICCCTQ
jgi:hypothetical protein